MSDSLHVPFGYAAALAELKLQVRAARFTAQRRVNTELVQLYWGIGRTILQRQDDEGWGSNVVGRLADDLRAEFPDMKGFSQANLFSMRRFAGAWPERSVVQQVVGQLPWGHTTVLLNRLDGPELRDWYADQAVAHGWSRNVLEHHIRTNAHTRLEAAPSNFADVLRAGESDLAQQITKDPYLLDFLALDGDARERQLEQALVDRIIDTLRELGEGFAFVERERAVGADLAARVTALHEVVARTPETAPGNEPRSTAELLLEQRRARGQQTADRLGHVGAPAPRPQDRDRAAREQAAERA